MTKSKITEYDNTATNNTDVEDVPLGENLMYPSHVNNAFREIMADLADVNDGTVSLTSPSFAAASLTGNLSFGDNDKAIFGADSDMSLFHNGNNAFLDNDTGSLFIQTDGFSVKNATGTESMMLGAADGAVTLYHNNSAKIATTATGIDVTGTVTADGLTVDGSSAGRVTLSTFTNTTNAAGTEAAIALRNQATGNADVSLVASRIGANFGSDFYIETSDSASGTNRKRFNIAEDGDISFYEDTGTTAKLFWDASAERLGLGTSSPSATLHVAGGNSNQFIIGQNTLVSGGSSRLQLVNTSDTSGTAGTAQGFQIINNGNDGIVNILNYKSTPMAFWTSGSERMRISSAGDVLISTTNNIVANSSTSSGTSIGSGLLESARAGVVAQFNRQTSDGSVIDIQKSGTTVGSIGVNNANNTFIGSTATAHTGLEFGDDILPRKGSNTADNQTNLGSSSIRFKDLHLGGVSYISDGTSSGTQTVVGGNYYIANSGAYPIVFQTNSSERLRITDAGLVGINTSSPAGVLEIVGSTGSAATSGGTLIVRQDGDANTDGIALTSSNAVSHRIWKNSSGALNIGSSSLPSALVQDLSGNIGIGESNPATRLEIKDATPILRLTDSFNGAQVAGHDIAGISFFSDDASGIGAHETGFIFNESEIGGTSLSGALVFGTAAYNTAAVERMRVNGSGMVLIGRTTSTLGGGNGSDLQIGSGTSSAGLTIHTSTSGLGDIQFADGTTGADSYRGLLRYNHSSNHMSIYTNGTEAARLESDADLHVNGNVVAYSTTISDIRLKKDIAPIEDAVTKVQQLNGCTFTYLKDDRQSAGLIAQDVEKVLPSAVIEDKAVFHGEEGETYKTVQYDQLIGLLVEAVKELKAEIEELKNGTAK